MEHSTRTSPKFPSDNLLSSFKAESPFLWNLSAILLQESANVLNRLLEKEGIAEEPQHEQFKFSVLLIQLLLSFELYNNGNISQSMMRIERCEAELNRLETKGCNERFYQTMQRPLWHVTLATKAILMAKMANIPITDEYMVREMGEKYSLALFNNSELAGILGIKSMSFLEYGFNGNMEALHWAQKALALDPTEAEWYFLTGKCMGRVRRCTRKFSGVPREEVEMLEKAVSLNPNPKYIINVAQVYQQSASAAFSHHRQDPGFYQSNLYRAIDNMNKKAVELYQQALVFHRNCSYSYIRCLNGMLKLPKKYLNFYQLREMINKVLQTVPNNTMFLHTVGVFYLKIEQDPKKALKYFEMASEQGNYGASMDAIRLRFKLNGQYNPVGRLRSLIEKFTAKPHHEDAITQLGSFYLFIVRDLERALKVYNVIIEKDPECRAMLVHKPIFVRMTRPVNLFQLLVNEVKVYEIKERPLDPQLKESFMSTMSRYWPHLMDQEVDTQMIHNLIKESRRMARAEKRRLALQRRYGTIKPRKRKIKTNNK